MRIAWVVPGGVDRSGRERVIPVLLGLLGRLARRHEVFVVALNQEPRPGRWQLLGAQVRNIGAWPRAARAVAALLAEHRRRPFDVIHAFWAAAPGAVAAAVGALTGRPVLTHVAGGELVALRDIGYGGGLTWRGRLHRRLSLMRAARITTASGQVADEVRALGREPELLPLGVDLQRWPPAAPRPRARAAPARLLHVASLNRVKDQRTLLRGAAHLAAQGVAFRLDVVGEDTLGGECQQLAEALGLRQVVFHGFLPQDELHPLVAAADVLLVTSRHEAGPVVTLEAAVAGVPTVGTAVGHVRDLAPEAAVAVPVGDAEGLARAVADLLADDERRLAIARAAQCWAISHDADWTAARVAALYEALARRRGRT